MTRRLTRRRQSGLTLLELMAASALLAIFFVSIFATVWGTINTRDKIEQKALPFSTGPVVMQRIVDDLLCADISDLKDMDGFEAKGDTVSGGDVTKIDFVAAVPSRDRVKIGDEWVRAAVNEIGYAVRRSELPDAPSTSFTRTTVSGGGAAVVRHSSRRSSSDLLALYRREDFGVDADPKEGGKYYKLCDRVKRFAIDFYDEDPGEPTGDDAEGATDWDAKEEHRLPWGCRVTLVLAGPGSADDEDAPARDYMFQTYVPLRTRFDKPDGAKPGATNTPGTNNPGSNNPGSNNPGSNDSGGK